MSDHKPADHIFDEWLTEQGMAVTFLDFSDLLTKLRAAFVEEVISEIDRCSDVLVTEADEQGNYLVAAVLQKATDIAREVGGLPKRGSS